MNKKIQYQRGFGILEVLITAVLLIIITGSVIGLNRLIVRNNIVSVERTQAYNLLRQEIENVITTRNANWEDKISWDTDLIDNTTSSTIDGIDYTIATTVVDVGDQFSTLVASEGDYLQNQAKKFSIVVSWSDASKEYSVSDEIILTNWKPQL